MAVNRLDPDMTDRVMKEDDYDYDHLMNVYSQILTNDNL